MAAPSILQESPAPPLLKEKEDLLDPSLLANNPQMKLIQMHDHLRHQLLRKIQRGTLSVSLLTRQTRLSQSHISNFLHGKRGLSPNAMDRILASQKLEAEDLLPDSHQRTWPIEGERTSVPIVSHGTALFARVVFPSASSEIMPLPRAALQFIRPHSATPRVAWQRFVAVRVSASDALPMEPVIFPEALVVIDQHYNALIPYRVGRQSPYAVRNGAHLVVSYVEFRDGKLVLRPHNRAFPVELLEAEPGKRPQELIVGRIALVQNPT